MTSKETKKRSLRTHKNESCNEFLLLLHNDEIHSFDYVIDALINICGHVFEQAVQCTLITHHKGRCDIRKGKFETLKQMKDALIAVELKATIEPQL